MMAYRIPRPPEAFSHDRDRKSRSARQHANSHLAFIRTLPCTVCGSRWSVEAAHVRYADSSYGKCKTGMGTKPDDRWTVPLCAECHRTGTDAQHAENEHVWWRARGIDPLNVAMRLYGASGDEEAAELILKAIRRMDGSVVRRDS